MEFTQHIKLISHGYSIKYEKNRTHVQQSSKQWILTICA